MVCAENGQKCLKEKHFVQNTTAKYSRKQKISSNVLKTLLNMHNNVPIVEQMPRNSQNDWKNENNDDAVKCITHSHLAVTF